METLLFYYYNGFYYRYNQLKNYPFTAPIVRPEMKYFWKKG